MTLVCSIDYTFWGEKRCSIDKGTLDVISEKTTKLKGYLDSVELLVKSGIKILETLILKHI